MFNKELMLELKGRLEPARQEFARREREWVHKLIHTQIPDDTSLFWLLPSQLVKNLQNVLGPSSEDRIQFFLEYQNRREQNKAAGRTVQISAEPIIKRCLSPDETDIREHGFIPFPYFHPKLKRNVLWTAVKKCLAPMFGDNAKRDAGEWIFTIEHGPWQVLTILAPNSSPWQFQLEHEIRIGMGPLDLRRRLSLHNVLGIGTGWNLVQPGEEENVAILASEYCRFFIAALPQLLDGLDPGIKPEEVMRAETEWKLGHGTAHPK